jgi:redox-sensitive bicupin YhaK (pirin superfamily)
VITVRRAAQRGHAQAEWGTARYTFSFADYFDNSQMGFRALRVLNEFRLLPGKGFGPHPHEDMEIVTYMLSGTIVQRDAHGVTALIGDDEVQRMGAGTGVLHDEDNASTREDAHFLHAWFEPGQLRATPTSAQKAFSAFEKRGKFRLIVSPDGADASLVISTDVRIHAAIFAMGEVAEVALAERRCAWVYVATGTACVNDEDLDEGDGAAIVAETAVRVEAVSACEVLVFDLA